MAFKLQNHYYCDWISCSTKTIAHHCWDFYFIPSLHHSVVMGTIDHRMLWLLLLLRQYFFCIFIFEPSHGLFMFEHMNTFCVKKKFKVWKYHQWSLFELRNPFTGENKLTKRGTKDKRQETKQRNVCFIRKMTYERCRNPNESQTMVWWSTKLVTCNYQLVTVDSCISSIHSELKRIVRCFFFFFWNRGNGFYRIRTSTEFQLFITSHSLFCSKVSAFSIIVSGFLFLFTWRVNFSVDNWVHEFVSVNRFFFYFFTDLGLHFKIKIITAIYYGYLFAVL